MRTNDNGTAVRAKSGDGYGYCFTAATLSCLLSQCAFMACMSFTLANEEVRFCIMRRLYRGLLDVF